MSLFEVMAKIGLDTSGYEKGLSKAKKSSNEYKKDVMNLAQSYKRQGMSMSDAMKKAYSEIDKSQYDMAKTSKKTSSEFGINWSGAIDKAKSAAKKLGEIAVVAAKAGAVVTGAATTAVTALATKSVQSYSQYEQLEGGVKKLYGNMGLSLDEYAKSVGKNTNEVKGEWGKLEKAQSIVLKNANNAYETAGMSANQYMEQATSFSASLISSLGGDTVKAAKQTDVAMRAMSDNVNVFGSDMQDVQNAFQGFAKQNYTINLVSVA